MKDLLSPEEIIKIGKLIKGAKLYVLQKFVSETALVDKKFVGKTTYSDDELIKMRQILQIYVQKVIIR